MSATTEYLLHLADNAVVLGQRNAEWCGHGPAIEEDIALANVSLDLIGQARLLYQQAAERIGNGATEDQLAYFRDVPDFRNYTLLELPHHSALVPPIPENALLQESSSELMISETLASPPKELETPPAES